MTGTSKTCPTANGFTKILFTALAWPYPKGTNPKIKAWLTAGSPLSRRAGFEGAAVRAVLRSQYVPALAQDIMGDAIRIGRPE